MVNRIKLTEYSVYLSDLYKTDPDYAWELVEQLEAKAKTERINTLFWDRGPLGFMKYKQKVIRNIINRYG